MARVPFPRRAGKTVFGNEIDRRILGHFQARRLGAEDELATAPPLRTTAAGVQPRGPSRALVLPVQGRNGLIDRRWYGRRRSCGAVTTTRGLERVAFTAMVALDACKNSAHARGACRGAHMDTFTQMRVAATNTCVIGRPLPLSLRMPLPMFMRFRCDGGRAAGMNTACRRRRRCHC